MFYLGSLIFAAVSLIHILLLENRWQYPLCAVLPCCLLAVLPELRLGAGGCRISPQCLCSIHPQTSVTVSSCQGTPLLTLSLRLTSQLVLRYPHLCSPALREPRATTWVTVGRWIALSAWHRAPVPSLRSLRRGLVSASSVLSALQLAFPAPAGPVPPVWASWGCQRKDGSLRGFLFWTGRSQSCPHSQGNGPKHQQCETGRVPLAKS